MNMRLMSAALVVVALLLPGCSKRMTAEQKIEMLESQRLEIIADLHRHRAECEAQAIEFANVPMRDSVVSSCLDGLRAMVEASQATLGNLDRRITELQPAWPALVPFSGKLGGDK